MDNLAVVNVYMLEYITFRSGELRSEKGDGISHILFSLVGR